MKLKIIGVLLIVFALVAGYYSYSGYIGEYFRKTNTETSTNLEQEARDAALKAREEYLTQTAKVEIPKVEEIIPLEEETEEIAPEELARVRVADNDVVAKLTIDACKIDTLVYENEVDDYYLRRDANGKDSVHGEIYTNCYDCKAPIIFGHHMKDGTMFASLDCAYIGATITLEDIGYLNDLTRTYTVTDIKNNVPACDVWDTLGEVEEGLVLVTCSYGIKDGRLIIICEENLAE